MDDKVEIFLCHVVIGAVIAILVILTGGEGKAHTLRAASGQG